MINKPIQNWAVRIFWICVGFCLILSSIWLCAISLEPIPSAYSLTISMFGAGFIYLCAVWLALRRSESLDFKYVLIVGVICRLILLPSAPLFYDGIYRDLWDGKVTASGINPYLYPPSSEKLIELRDDNWARLTDDISKSTNSPLVQVLLGVSYTIGLHSVALLKLMLFIFDLGCMLLIVSILKMLRLPRCWVLVYAWSPLAIKEFANSGHLEPVMLFFLLLALHCWFMNGRCKPWAGAAYGAAVAGGFAVAVLVPVACKLGKWKSAGYAAVTLAAFYYLFVSAGKYLITGASAYAQIWTFNDGAYALLRITQSYLYSDVWKLPVLPSRVIAALVIGIYAVCKARKLPESDRIATIAAMRNIFTACLLVMPMVQPWYVCWLLPFMCVSMSIGLLLFTVTCSLSYLNFINGSLPVWVLVLEYVPVYIVLIAEHHLTKKFAPPPEISRVTRRSKL